MPFSWDFTLTPREPYSFELTVRKPAGWSLFTPTEVYDAGVLWTAERLESGKVMGLRLQSLGTVEKPRIRCGVFTREELKGTERRAIEDVVLWVLKVDEDLTEFYSLAKSDSLVKILVKDLYGMHYTDRVDLFPDLILAVTLQMAPMERSDQMMDLLIKHYGDHVHFNGREVTLWPSPKNIATASVKDLMKKCKLGYRAKNLKKIARTLCGGFPTLRQLAEMPPEETKEKLMELYGIGDYSADIVSPHFGFPVDVWSAEIFSLLMSGKLPENPRKAIAEIKKRAEERWGTCRGYVFISVLNDLGNLSEKYGFDLLSL